jgi:Flp pilus assembly protein TadG
MLCQWENRGSRRRRAAAAAELAVVAAPVLCLILVAATDFARLFFAYETITDCASNGAIYGSTDATYASNSAGIKAAALADATSLSPQPSVSSTTATDANGNPCVKVTVSYTFTTLVPYLGIPSTVKLSRTVQMRVLQDTPN